ncbi:MAG: GIY-YIG nuclease family protein [Microgenomates group bacterium]
MNWFIYIVRCKDNSLYTGITNNLERRVREHNEKNKIGSRYVRSKRPAVLVFNETASSKSEALKREAEIKKLSHLQKIQLIAGGKH